MFVRIRRGKKEVTPVPVSGTIDKDTRPRRFSPSSSCSRSVLHSCACSCIKSHSCFTRIVSSIDRPSVHWRNTLIHCPNKVKSYRCSLVYICLTVEDLGTRLHNVYPVMKVNFAFRREVKMTATCNFLFLGEKVRKLFVKKWKRLERIKEKKRKKKHY